MCDVMTALSVASGVVSFMGQQQASQQAAQSAYDATVLQQQQIHEQQVQINQESSLKESERIKQGMIERAKIATISGESGALGLSSDRLIGDSFMQQGTDMASMEQNRQNSIKQTEWESKAATARGQSGINEANNKAPSLIGTGLQIAGDVFKGKTAASTKAKAGV